MKTLQDLREKTAQLVGTTVQIPLTADNSDQDLHLDSMAVLELLVGLEKEFGIQVDEAQVDPVKHFRSVETISEFVFENLKTQDIADVPK